MKIDGSAFGERIATPVSAGGRATNSYDAQIQRLQKERERYVEKLQKVRDETSDPKQAEDLAKIYQAAITSIDSRIGQLQQAKAEEAQRRVEEQQAKTKPSRTVEESDSVGQTPNTKKAEKPAESAAKPEASRDDDDLFAVQDGEELFWIDGADGSWLEKKRKPEYPSVLVDMTV